LGGLFDAVEVAFLDVVEAEFWDCHAVALGEPLAGSGAFTVGTAAATLLGFEDRFPSPPLPFARSNGFRLGLPPSLAVPCGLVSEIEELFLSSSVMGSSGAGADRLLPAVLAACFPPRC